MKDTGTLPNGSYGGPPSEQAYKIYNVQQGGDFHRTEDIVNLCKKYTPLNREGACSLTRGKRGISGHGRRTDPSKGVGSALLVFKMHSSFNFQVPRYLRQGTCSQRTIVMLINIRLISL
jgi:hypothetical protein